MLTNSSFKAILAQITVIKLKLLLKQAKQAVLTGFTKIYYKHCLQTYFQC